MKRGLTLIEVLVGLTITLILMASGVAAFRQTARRQTLETTADRLRGVLVTAQTNALSGVKDTTSCPGLDLAGWEVKVAADSVLLRGVCGSVAFAPRSILLPVGVTATAFPSPNPILFRVLGQGTNVSGTTTVTLTGGGGLTRDIVITSSGEIR